MVNLHFTGRVNGYWSDKILEEAACVTDFHEIYEYSEGGGGSQNYPYGLVHSGGMMLALISCRSGESRLEG